MCGRYMLTAMIEEINAAFGINARVPIPERYNIAPRQPVLAVRKGGHGNTELVALEWGLVPEWKKEMGDKPLINARVETITEKPSFRGPVKRSRCLVPFSGWYEWKTVAGRKQPYFISPSDDKVGAFAGIWTVWHGPSGDHWLETVAIVTGEANDALKPVHHRKPLVVKPADYGRWLEPHDPLPRGFLEGFDWVSESQFHWRPVSMKVNSAVYDRPDCISQPEEERQASLF